MMAAQSDGVVRTPATGMSTPATGPSRPLVERLGAVVGPGHVLTDPELTASYEVDWTGRFRGSATCVVRPASTPEVAAVLRTCARFDTPVVVQGGNTGLVGGSVPSGGEVVLSLRRLSRLDPVDETAAQVRVGAGVTLDRLASHARQAGFDVGVDLASRSQATVGGLIATNAGGIRVIRHGSMRSHVVGLEAVLADGTVFGRLDPAAKENTGYQLAQLLCGSEGTLAVITAARLRLIAAPGPRAVALVAVADTATAQAVLAVARSRLSLCAAELFFADGLALVCAATGLPAPFPVPYPAYLLLECEDRTSPLDDLLGVLEECPQVMDATAADDSVGVARLWAYRERHTEAIGTEAIGAGTVAVKLDVCVPAGALPTLIDEAAPTVGAVAPHATTIAFGHLNESNVHINVLGAGAAAEEVEEALLRLVSALGGAISSEHGIGRAKAHWLALSRTAEEIGVMRRVKHALDPMGLLNPGVLFET